MFTPAAFPTAAVRSLRAALIVAGCCTIAAAQTGTETFEDGALTPFNVEVAGGNESSIVAPPGFNARAGSLVHRTKWYQANYDGTRATRGVEGSSGQNKTLLPWIKSEGWYAFSFYLKSGEFPANKKIILAQLFAWSSDLPDPDKTLAINRTELNELKIHGFYGVGNGSPAQTAVGTLLTNVAYDTWHDIIIYAKFSNNNTGILKAWVDGAPESTPTFSATNINFGNDVFTGANTLQHGCYVKWGQYDWDTSGYVAGETRTLYNDEIRYQNGNPAGSFNLVKPTGYGLTLVAETFDGMTAGSAPAGWTVVNDPSTTCTVQNTPSTSDRSMRFTDSNTTGYSRATKTFAATSGLITAAWRHRQDQQSNWNRFFLQSGSTVAVELYTIASGDDSSTYGLYYRNAAGGDFFVAALNTATWYDIKVEANTTTDTADIYVNGVLRKDNAPFRTAVTSVNSILFGSGGSSTMSGLYVDDVTVTK